LEGSASLITIRVKVDCPGCINNYEVRYWARHGEGMTPRELENLCKCCKTCKGNGYIEMQMTSMEVFEMLKERDSRTQHMIYPSYFGAWERLWR
jgi:hypothetical protein